MSTITLYIAVHEVFQLSSTAWESKGNCDGGNADLISFFTVAWEWSAEKVSCHPLAEFVAIFIFFILDVLEKESRNHFFFFFLFFFQF